MRNKSTVFYRGNTEVSVDFSSEDISSDGSVLLLEKLKREHKLLRYFSRVIPDNRDPLRTIHKVEKLLKQRVYTLMQGYEDTNDVNYLKNDPLYKDILDGNMASQPTMSRFENRMDKSSIFTMCYAWVDRYVSTLKNRNRIIIDIDATDDQTYGTSKCPCSMDIMVTSCTTSCFSMMEKQGRLLSRYYALAIAIQTNGMWLF